MPTTTTATRRAVLLAGLLALAAGCGSQAEREGRWAWKPILKAVKQAGRSETDHSLDLRKLVRFEWDHFVVVPAYASAETVSSRLGFEWDDYKKSITQLRDNWLLHVFTNDGRVVAWFDLPRDRADFGPLLKLGAIAKQDAVFTVKESPTTHLPAVHPRDTYR